MGKHRNTRRAVAPAVAAASRRAVVDALESRRLFVVSGVGLVTPDLAELTTQFNPSVEIQLSVDPGVTFGPSATRKLTVTSPTYPEGNLTAIFTGVASGALGGPAGAVLNYSVLNVAEGLFEAAYTNGPLTLSAGTGEFRAASGAAIAGGDVGTFTIDITTPTLQGYNSAAALTLGINVRDTAFDGKDLVLAGSQVTAVETTNPDGTPAVAASTRAVLARLDENGKLDLDFGEDRRGIVALRTNFGQSSGSAVAVRPDHQILWATSRRSATVPGGGDATVFLFGPDGVKNGAFGPTRGGDRDTQFQPIFEEVTGPGGATSNPFAEYHSIALQPDGKAVLAGEVVHQVSGGPLDSQSAVTRINADGSFDDGGAGDTTPADRFGPDGAFASVVADPVAADPRADDAAGTVAVDADGRIVLAGVSRGSSGASADARVFLTRYDPAGAGVDPAFNGGENLVLPGLSSPDDAFAVGLAVAADRSLYVAAATADGNFALAHRLADGAADPAFGPGGVATADFGGTDDADRVLLTAAGKILVVGTSRSGDTVRTAVASFNPDGSLDAGFGNAAPGLSLFDPDVLSAAAPAADLAAALGADPQAVSFPGVLGATAAQDDAGDVVFGRAKSGAASTFRKLIPADRAAPTAALAAGPFAVDARSATAPFVVTFADDSQLDATTIAPAALVITRAGGGAPLAVAGVTLAGTGASVTATFAVAAPDGAWDDADAGAYDVSVVAGSVADGAARTVAGGSLGTATMIVRTIVEEPPPGPLSVALDAARVEGTVSGGKVKFDLTATVSHASDATARYDAKAEVRLFLATGGVHTTADPSLAVKALRLRLNPGASKAVALKVRALDPVPDGSYQFLAVVSAVGADGAATAVARKFSTDSVRLEFPAADVALTGVAVTAADPTPAGGRVRVVTTIENVGNLAVLGRASYVIELVPAGDPTGAAVARPFTKPKLGLSIRPDNVGTYPASFKLPEDLAAGSYRVRVTLDPKQLNDVGPANDVAVSEGLVVVG